MKESQWLGYGDNLKGTASTETADRKESIVGNIIEIAWIVANNSEEQKERVRYKSLLK